VGGREEKERERKGGKGSVRERIGPIAEYWTENVAQGPHSDLRQH